MKRLTEQNYYTLLGIPPNASFGEVQSAYDQATNMYSADSIATYSLFSQQERERILSRLVDAYKTLTNSQLRREYDDILIKRGELSSQDIGFSSLKDANITKGKLREVSTESLIQKEEDAEIESKPSESNFELFNSQTSVTGKSIKMVRTVKEISLDEICRKTNIPKKTLEDIEEDHFERLPALVYLKGFLKAYSKILNIDQAEIVDGYVKRYLEWKNTYQK